MKTILNLPIKSLNLDKGDNGVRLGDLTIAGIPFHVMFIEVDEDGNAVGDCQDMIDGVANSDEGCDYQTVKHEGRDYFVVIHPHQA